MVESRLESRIRTWLSALYWINFPQFPFPFPYLISIKNPFSFLAELSLHRLSFRAWPWFDRILLSISKRPCLVEGDIVQHVHASTRQSSVLVLSDWEHASSQLPSRYTLRRTTDCENFIPCMWRSTQYFIHALVRTWNK